MKFELATDEDRRNLAHVRAKEWGKILTPEQFAERNLHLYQHSFANRVDTFALRDDKKIVASMDIVRLNYFANRSGRVEIVPGILIASVIVPPEERNKGYATDLLNAYFEHEKGVEGILFSDVGPKFYSRFGFEVYPVLTHIREAKPDKSERTPIPVGDFLSFQSTFRQIKTQKTPRSLSLIPEADWIDWRIEVFRFTAKLAGKTLDETRLCWALSHGGQKHQAMALPNYLTKALQVLWKHPGCPDCIDSLAAIAADQGLKTCEFWESCELDEKKAEFPMLRLNPLSEACSFSDIQWGDWW